MKILITLLISLSAISAHAISKIHLMEKCSHALMKLAKSGKLPIEADAKMHMMRVTENAAGFEILAVLDHNEDHSQPAANVKFQYSADGVMQTFQYTDGYISPVATAFTEKSAAHLFDLGTEIVFEGENAEMLAYADGVYMAELSYLAPSNQALLAMIDADKKVLSVVMDLSGNYVSHEFSQAK